MKALKSLRLHIGIFGKTNVGKSSFLNKITKFIITVFIINKHGNFLRKEQLND